MIVKLLTEHHLEFLSLKGGCRDSSEPTHVITCQNATLLGISCTDSNIIDALPVQIYTKETMKNYKGIEGHKFFKSGWVQTIFSYKPDNSTMTVLKETKSAIMNIFRKILFKSFVKAELS